jgi:hypothetical protein
VKNRFQSLPFKCNLQRYTTEPLWGAAFACAFLGERMDAKGLGGAVGLCRLNQVDP